MKLVVATVAVVTTSIAFSFGTATGSRAPRWIAPSPTRPTPTKRPAAGAATRVASSAHPSYPAVGARGISMAALNGVIEQYCQDCHNEQLLTGNLSLEGFDVATANTRVPVAEKMIRKLRAQMMPMPGSPRPGGDTLTALVETI
jgi:hypothetical protein